jgi:hypothetical protein
MAWPPDRPLTYRTAAPTLLTGTTDCLSLLFSFDARFLFGGPHAGPVRMDTLIIILCSTYCTNKDRVCTLVASKARIPPTPRSTVSVSTTVKKSHQQIIDYNMVETQGYTRPDRQSTLLLVTRSPLSHQQIA